MFSRRAVANGCRGRSSMCPDLFCAPWWVFPLKLSFDGLDLDHGKLLAVAAFALHALALFLFEHDDFFATLVFENGHRDACAREGGLANLVSSAFAGASVAV